MKVTTADIVLDKLKDGMSVMVGGFLSIGTPEILIEEIIEKGIKNLTIIANDGGIPGAGVARLVEAGLVKRLIVSHIGMTPKVAELMNEGKLEVELVPQGTLAERIRAGGAGLGGVLTPTGIGTDVAHGKEVITVDNKEYLLEKPLHADVAIIRGSVVDGSGNVMYKGTTRNFNPLMATAADLVIVGAEKIVPDGTIAGEQIVTPGIFVDYIVGGEPHVR